MAPLSNPYISRITIKNYRNFLNVDIEVGGKQVIIGENNVGKTNFIRAIQLVLDRNMNDNDRQLDKNDFHDSLEEPMISGQEIEIGLYIRGYDHHKQLKAQFVDAVVQTEPPTIFFKYKFFPRINTSGAIVDYVFGLYKGPSEDVPFTHEDRKYLNIYVIRALRDVERELRGSKSSPLYKITKRFEIPQQDLVDIAVSMNAASLELYELDELVYIKESVQKKFNFLSGLQRDNQVSLQTFDIDPERLLFSLQVYLGEKIRPVSELSMGMSNILFVSLILIYLNDWTIKRILTEEQYQKLAPLDEEGLLSKAYLKSQKGKYVINRKKISGKLYDKLYKFMQDYNSPTQEFTILAIEEPEAHLHPLLQRLLYKHVLNESLTSVIFSSHSTFISSVAPIDSIVHIRSEKGVSSVKSSANLNIQGMQRKDLERYVDAKRGELYFAKLVILVEGITEEYLLPAASILLNKSLDNFGIVVCNINSTDFTPYIRLLSELGIPWSVVTDGDYYISDKEGNRTYHTFSEKGTVGYLGNERVELLLRTIGELGPTDNLPKDWTKQDEFLITKECYVGRYTCEIDLMENSVGNNYLLLKKIYDELCDGGNTMKRNFAKDLTDGKYWEALGKIEDNIGKGRFAQRLASELEVDMLPGYIKSAIENAVARVKRLQ